MKNACLCLIGTVVMCAEIISAAPSQSIEVTITKLEITERKFEIVVEVSNRSNAAVQFWDLESHYGRAITSFAFREPSGAIVRVHRKEDKTDFSGKPRIESINPNKSKTWTLDLMDGTWQLPEYIGDGSAQQVEAELNAPSVGSDGSRLAWAGNVTSKPMKMPKPLRMIWTANALPFWPASKK